MQCSGLSGRSLSAQRGTSAAGAARARGSSAGAVRGQCGRRGGGGGSVLLLPALRPLPPLLL